MGVADGRIAALGDLSGYIADRRLDAAGRIVAPGFIDVHGHDDLMFVEKPDLAWKTSQGITSVVVGNCGISGAPAPLPGNHAAALALLGESPLYADMDAYFATLQAQRPMINVAALVGHANLRLAAMRDPSAQPTADEQRAMGACWTPRWRPARSASAPGWPTSRAAWRGRPSWRDWPAWRPRARALHTSHIRNEGDTVEESVDEVLSIGRQSGCATVLSHHKCMMPRNWGKSRATLANIDRARAEGRGRGAGHLSLSRQLHHPDPGARRADRRHPRHLVDAASRVRGPLPGRHRRRLGCDRTEAARRLCPAGAIYFAMDENEVRRIFQHDCCMVGSDGLPNDAHPHPRLWGSFTRVLGRYVREAELLTLEAAVAKMSALPARVFGLAGRGRIAVGAWADIVVFDADTVADLATWEAPTLPSAGVERVLVNGVQVHPPLPDTPRPGQILRRSVAAQA